MTGVSAFLFFFHKHTIITIKDATLIHNHGHNHHKHGRRDADTN